MVEEVPAGTVGAGWTWDSMHCSEYRVTGKFVMLGMKLLGYRTA